MITKFKIINTSHTSHMYAWACHLVLSNSETLWTVARQTPLSMGFSRQEYWCRLSLPFPGDLPNPGLKRGSPLLQADFLQSEPPGNPNLSCYPLLMCVNCKFSLCFSFFWIFSDFKEPRFVFVDFSA